MALTTHTGPLILRGDWDTQVQYISGEVAVHGGYTWACLRDLTTSITPGTDSTAWFKLAALDGGGGGGSLIDVFKGAWDVGASYKRGDLVTDQGSCWIATAQPSVGEKPPGTDWALVAEKGADGQAVVWKGDWKLGTVYEALDAAAHAKHGFMCIKEHTASADDEPETGPNWENIWVSIGAAGPKGDPGPAGRTILSGDAPPAPDTGQDGDYYLQASHDGGGNVTSLLLYGPKSAEVPGQWPAQPAQLIGPKGSKGDPGSPGYTPNLLKGTGAPESSIGVDGDLYVDTVSGDFYGRTQGAWDKKTNMQGPAGPKGDTGAPGADGPAGPKGDTGPAGPKGDKGDPGESPIGGYITVGPTSATSTAGGAKMALAPSGTLTGLDVSGTNVTPTVRGEWDMTGQLTFSSAQNDSYTATFTVWLGWTDSTSGLDMVSPLLTSKGPLGGGNSFGMSIDTSVLWDAEISASLHVMVTGKKDTPSVRGRVHLSSYMHA